MYIVKMNSHSKNGTVPFMYLQFWNQGISFVDKFHFEKDKKNRMAANNQFRRQTENGMGEN